MLTIKLGILARAAAVAGALLAVPLAASAAGPAAKTASHARKASGKRAVVGSKPKQERAHSKDKKTSARAAAAEEKASSASKGAKAAADAKPGVKDAKSAAKAAKDAKPAKAKPEPKVRASSVGSPNEGRLVGGVKLDTSDASVRVVPAYKRGDSRWGLPALIHMIERAAKKVAKKHPGAVLGVGDISHKNGGDIFLHRSHESGRDADIAFYVVNQRGKDIKPDTFVTFQGSVESSSMPGARFDVAKNWLLVQAMLEDPGARVSHIFVADPLRRMLLAHAKPRVSAKLYSRAAAVMMQPSNALPHDNHFHVRISCPAEMRKSCVEYPVGVFSKKAKGKGKTKTAIVTPKKKQAAKSAAATAPAKSTSEKPGAHASRAARRRSRKPAQAEPVPAAPKGSATERRLARDTEPRKKPVYLQSAVANSDDPLDSVLFSVPALSHLTGTDTDADSDADAAEGEDNRAAVDDSGTVKITE
ncbi:MAG: penicillin-insensitive murein endopeptidase [Polyangiaceae bacterium]